MSKQSKVRRKPNEPMKLPKYTQPFMIDNEEVAQACSHGPPDEGDLSPSMSISIDSMSLSPNQARKLSKWLLREANYVEQYVKVERFNRRLKAKNPNKEESDENVE